MTAIYAYSSEAAVAQPREGEIYHVASTATTEFFAVEGLRPNILLLTERRRRQASTPLLKSRHPRSRARE